MSKAEIDIPDDKEIKGIIHVKPPFKAMVEEVFSEEGGLFVILKPKRKELWEILPIHVVNVSETLKENGAEKERKLDAKIAKQWFIERCEEQTYRFGSMAIDLKEIKKAIGFEKKE